jgi:hypothetical protein
MEGLTWLFICVCEQRIPFSLKNSRYQSPGRGAIVSVLAAESNQQDFFFNLNPIEKNAADWDKDDENAEPVREGQTQAQEGEQAAGVCRMANKPINAFRDQAMLLSYGHVHCELFSESKNCHPAENQAAEDKGKAGKGKYPGSGFNVANASNSHEDAPVDGEKNNQP